MITIRKKKAKKNFRLCYCATCVALIDAFDTRVVESLPQQVFPGWSIDACRSCTQPEVNKVPSVVHSLLQYPQEPMEHRRYRTWVGRSWKKKKATHFLGRPCWCLGVISINNKLWAFLQFESSSSSLWMILGPLGRFFLFIISHGQKWVQLSHRNKQTNTGPFKCTSVNQDL